MNTVERNRAAASMQRPLIAHPALRPLAWLMTVTTAIGSSPIARCAASATVASAPDASAVRPWKAV